MLRRPLAIATLVYIAGIIGVAIVAPIALPGIAGEHAGDFLAVRQGPSAQHLLGTDELGRDILDRLLVGTRVTVVGVAEALAVVLALGVPLGLAAGFMGGAIDRVVGWLADLAFSIPSIIVVLVVLSVFPQSMLAAMITLGVLAAPGLMRVVRSATLPVREEMYVDAARVAGLSRFYIATRHVLPRIAGAVIVQASLLSALALLVQTGLAFLDLIVAAPAPSWGGMVADGITSIDLQPWLIWPPGIAIALTALALGLFGDLVRDTATEVWAPQGEQKARRTRTPRAHAAVRLGSSTDLLAVENLTVELDTKAGSVPILEDVTFGIRKGEIVGLVGESGCGKTMTAMAVLGLLPHDVRVTSGQILLNGEDLAHAPESKLRRVRGRQIALIAQDPMVSLNPVFRVGTQLAESVRVTRGLTRRRARLEALELLRRVQLPDPASVALRYPHELSGGMSQRVCIARALAGEPHVLIADEPTTALDVTVQAEILLLLRDLQREREMAVLFITHDWGVVADVCDRVVVMYAGEVVEQSDPISIFQAPRHPYTEALLAANPYQATAASMLLTIPGAVPRPGSWPAGCHFQPRCRYASTECASGPIAMRKLTQGRETRCIHDDLLVRA